MTKDKSILIKNIYYMLTYAFQVLKQSNYENVETESFDNIYDMFAAILSKGVAQQLKQGLYREYVTKNDDLSVMRGKLDINSTINNKVQRKQVLSCEFDELSENNIFNQIVKLTLIILIKQKNVKVERKKSLKKIMLYFSNIDVIEPSVIRWGSLHFQRNNQSYKMLINICYLILDGLLLSTDKGEYKMATFLDEQHMHRLYEKFILEYYKFHHKDLKPHSEIIYWAVDDGVIDLLPVMQTDITLRNNDKTLIIDAKYYGKTMQTQYDKHSLHSANMYQIFTYVKNQDKDNTGDVSGMLLYAKTEEDITPNNDYMMNGNRISVKTLDLNQEFSEITRSLEGISNSL